MNLDRRSFLQAGAALGVLGATGCDAVYSLITRIAGQGVPDSIGDTSGELIDPCFHLLSRAAFGPWPGDVDRVREMGSEAWIEEQLDPESIDDTLCRLRIRFESIHASTGELFEYRKKVVREELTRATLLRAIYSKRQLQEVMVRFWSDHLNVDISKGRCSHLKAADDREVIRAHALGQFRDLIRASALSPAMLVYLDGTENRKRTEDEAPNENYARELLELHTLGVDGGYTQQDVMEAARCLTGWRVRRKWKKGQVVFDSRSHDDGAKEVLGEKIPSGGGEEDLDRLLDIVCSHPSTSRHVAGKLCRRFVSDDPPAGFVERIAEVFRDSDGDIAQVMRAILTSDELASARGARFKRPFRFVVSSLRAVAADTHAKRPLLRYLERLGQPPFQYPTPDGYPDQPEPWMGTLLWRWNFAIALCKNRIPKVKVRWKELRGALELDDEPMDLARLSSYLLGRAPTSSEQDAITDVWDSDQRLAAGLILAAPAYQRY